MRNFFLFSTCSLEYFFLTGTDCFEENIVLQARRPTGGSEKHSGTGAVSPRGYAPHSKSAPEPKARDANSLAAYTR